MAISLDDQNKEDKLEDHAMTQAVSRRLPQRRTGLDPRQVQVACVVDSGTRTSFLKYVGFTCQYHAAVITYSFIHSLSPALYDHINRERL
jgi:hypothetical protein